MLDVDEDQPGTLGKPILICSSSIIIMSLFLESQAFPSVVCVLVSTTLFTLIVKSRGHLTPA